MLEYVYVLDYKLESTNPPSNQAFMLGLGMHARLYGAGDKYGMKGLKAIAEERFSKCLNHYTWEGDSSDSIQSFAGMMEHIFTSTPDSDKGLRIPIVDYSRHHLKKMLKDESFKEVLARVPDLAYELLVQEVEKREMVDPSPTKKQKKTPKKLVPAS